MSRKDCQDRKSPVLSNPPQYFKPVEKYAPLFTGDRGHSLHTRVLHGAAHQDPGRGEADRHGNPARTAWFHACLYLQYADFSPGDL